MIKKIKSFAGFIGLLGLAGMAEAITGNGSFMVSAIVFSIGFGICLDDLFKKGEN